MIKIKNNPLFLFLVIFGHITLLDLFYVSHNGPVFLWDENLAVTTMATHFLIALVSVIFYFLVVKFRKDYQAGQFKISERTWVLCSCALILSIGFVLI